MATDIINELNESLCERTLRDSKQLEGILGKASHAFRHVCQDECADLIKTVRSRAEAMARAGASRYSGYANICSEYVVKEVESNLLGCCGRSCGWNGHVCFLTRV